jgi:hypothetical protein
MERTWNVYLLTFDSNFDLDFWDSNAIIVLCTLSHYGAHFCQATFVFKKTPRFKIYGGRQNVDYTHIITVLWVWTVLTDEGHSYIVPFLLCRRGLITCNTPYCTYGIVNLKHFNYFIDLLLCTLWYIFATYIDRQYC